MRRALQPRNLLLALTLCALASSSALADSALTPALREFLGNEQGRISRSVDTTRLIALDNHQDPTYSPEKGRTFTVKSYWVDAGKMHAFEGIGINPQIKKLFVREVNGRKQVRLLVHPESTKLYDKLVRSGGASAGGDFKATATASSRTLVAWPAGKPQQALFAKLSLDKMIGGVRRTISQGEVARSVGINNVLAMAASRRELPRSFKFIPETFSAIPKGMSEGGMIIREIPKEMASGKRKYVPMFALYATPKNGGEPLLATMIRQSGMTPKDFMRDKIIRPFAKQWIQLAVQGGINAEPHGQNLMIELDHRNQPTGVFVHRDFGGFDIDFAYRRERKLALPKVMTSITTVQKDYKVSQDPARALRKLDSFFWGGLAYNLDKDLPQWGRTGLLKGKGQLAKGEIKRMLEQELVGQYHALTGKTVRLDGSFRNVTRMLAARKAPTAKAQTTVQPMAVQPKAQPKAAQPKPRRTLGQGLRRLLRPRTRSFGTR